MQKMILPRNKIKENRSSYTAFCGVARPILLSIKNLYSYFSLHQQTHQEYMPSKQWVHTWHFGRPMASTSCSMVLNFREVKPNWLAISSTIF